ncbi:gastric inhibitory polypeptide receptor isoform X10 [Mesocricetus auratus]|uniref:Gastric inhibitory polypeptide receptor isoform X10 n=1 Tax=Mesocricetus auratus TaxID=10036 RepID=A0ABM2WHW7_MESAU|nr:gastric inhibitory polypeptide receptor isoform X10 [Mesocricetus auratus]
MPLRPRLLLLCLWGLLLQQAETDSEGQTTGELYQRWERYARECEETLTAADPPSGMVCNGSFDMYVCWDYTAANTTAQASCPWYLPWYRHVAAGYVFRQCGSDGQWGPWRDHTQCENPEKNGAFQDQRLILERLQVVYTVGYSLSLGTLLLALLILSLFRCDPAPPAPRDGVETRASVYLRAELGDGVVLGEGPEEGGWRDSEDSSPGTPSPFVSQIPQAAALHSKLHPHERVLVFHASGGGHPHPGPAAAYPGSLPWGPDPYPAEPGPSRLPHGPDRDPVLRGCQLHLAAGRGCIPAPSAGDRGRLGKGPLPLLPASWLGGPRAFRHSLGDRQVPAGEHAVLGAQRGQSHLVDHSHPHPNNHLDQFLHLHPHPWHPCVKTQDAADALPGLPTAGFLVSVLYCFINKEVQSEIRRSWRHRVLHLSLRDERPCPHAELGPQALPSRSAPREVPITGSTLPSGPLHGPGEEVLESYC